MTDCNNCKHETECNYTQRYDYKYDAVVDYQTDKEYNSFKDISELLNEKDKRIRELEEENKQLRQGKYIYGIHGGSND